VKTKKRHSRNIAKNRTSRSRQQKSATSQVAAEKRFLNDLAIRGDAAEPTAEGKLPLDATYAILEKNPDGTVKKVKAVRKKLF
jgi:hypothetical protein